MTDDLKQLQRNEIDAAKDSHDRRWACDSLSEDYFKFSKDASEHVRNAIEIQKLENEHEIELKKIEIEQNKVKLDNLKIEKGDSLKNPKFWIEEVVIPVGMKTITLCIWTTMFMMGSKYEKTDITTLSGMKGVMRCITDGAISAIKGDRI